MTIGGDDITPEDVCRIWPLSRPVRLRRIALGTNNRSFIVECGGDGVTYFLKLYDNPPDPERRVFANRITAAIALQRPPFAVPETIRSRSGETQVLLGDRYHHVSSFIPGSVARYGDRDDAAACGRALAELHAALASVDLGSSHAGPPTFGPLATVHPLVPEPERAIETALSDADLAQTVTGIVSSAEARWLHVTAGWPLTWIHADFYPSNVLMRSRQVTGIVDFEFAGAGYRAIDVAIGVYAFAFWQPGFLVLVERFATGYLERIELSAEEIRAIPVMILMREATSFVHWTGRYRQGLTNRTGIEERAGQLVKLAGFLGENGAELTARLHHLNSRLH